MCQLDLLSSVNNIFTTQKHRKQRKKIKMSQELHLLTGRKQHIIHTVYLSDYVFCFFFPPNIKPLYIVFKKKAWFELPGPYAKTGIKDIGKGARGYQSCVSHIQDGQSDVQHTVLFLQFVRTLSTYCKG